MKKHHLACILFPLIGMPLSCLASNARPYFDVDFQYAHVSNDLEVKIPSLPGWNAKGSGSMNLYGATVSGGAYFGDAVAFGKGTEFDNGYDIGVHQVGLETGLLFGDEKASGPASSAKVDYLVAPILAIYNYNFVLPENRGLVYIGPCLGVVVMNTKFDAQAGASKFGFQDAAAAAAAGFQAGVKFTMNRNLMIQAGYRLLATTDFSYEAEISGTKIQWDVKNPVSHSFSVGFSFVY